MAYSFNSSGQSFVATPPAASRPFSIACWFYPTDITQDALLARIVVGANSLDLVARSNATHGNSVMGNTNSIVQFVKSTTGYSVNTWNHALYTCASATDHAAYLNGGNKGTSTSNFGSGSTSTLTINGVTSVTCRIAELAFWDVQLSDEEAAALASGASPALIRRQSLKYYTPLIRVARDLRGASITTNGSPTVIEHPRVFMGSDYSVSKVLQQVDVTRSAANAILFSQNADPTEIARSVASSFAFSQTAMPPFAELSATNSIAFSQDQIPFQDMQQSIAFNSAAFTPEVVRSILQSINFKQQIKAVVGNIASGRYRR